jgi:hypothetical protein
LRIAQVQNTARPCDHFLNYEAPALVAGVLRLAGRSIASAMAFTAAVARFSMPQSADLAGAGPIGLVDGAEERHTFAFARPHFLGSQLTQRRGIAGNARFKKAAIVSRQDRSSSIFDKNYRNYGNMVRLVRQGRTQAG